MTLPSAPRRSLRNRFRAAMPLLALPLALIAVPPVAARNGSPVRPDILLVTVDTLRTDHVSFYGYDRPTTPRIDALLEAGVAFREARTVEPLTTPALASTLMSLYPHEHGSTRNGLRVLEGLASLPRSLHNAGYRTAAFVGNWTLRDKLSGLAEHFDVYEEVLTRKRWFGLVRGEATADDLTEQALAWLTEHREDSPDVPCFLWVHYVDPHAPYRLHTDAAGDLGIPTAGKVPPADRYDTEVRFVDASIGRLLDGARALDATGNSLVVFAADHGESLGEHDYWGHGRNLYEEALRIPMAVVWPGHLAPRVVRAPAVNLDLAPTVLGLLGLPSPSAFRGYDWTGVFRGTEAAFEDRVTFYQAHKGAVVSRHESMRARRAGLVELGWIRGNVKETFRLESGYREMHDLTRDPDEVNNLVAGRSEATERLSEWVRTVVTGLNEIEAPVDEIDAESAAKLRSLGYVD